MTRAKTKAPWVNYNHDHLKANQKGYIDGYILSGSELKAVFIPDHDKSIRLIESVYLQIIED